MKITKTFTLKYIGKTYALRYKSGNLGICAHTLWEWFPKTLSAKCIRLVLSEDRLPGSRRIQIFNKCGDLVIYIVNKRIECCAAFMYETEEFLHKKLHSLLREGTNIKLWLKVEVLK